MPLLDISEETYQKIKEQLKEEELVDINAMEDFIGKKVFIRTVTYHTIGEVVKQVGFLLQLKNASWVADSGSQLADFLKAGISESSEIEPVGECWVNADSIVDMFLWKHKLPDKQQ